MDLVSIDEFENAAAKKLPRQSYVYYRRGQTPLHFTRDESKRALRRYRLRPKILRDVSSIDLSTEVLGHQVKMPIGVSPSAAHCHAHADGEVATAQGAARFDTIMIVSVLANKPIAEITKAARRSIIWSNLYFFKTHAVTEYLIRNAEKAGCKAFVVTIDAPSLMVSSTMASTTLTYMTENPRLLPVNIDVEVPENRDVRMRDKSANKSEYTISEIEGNHATPEDIKWLRTFTKLPIILKGVMSAATARVAVKLGVDGLIVSAHGGRQLEFLPAPIDVLSEVVDAVRGSSVEVYVDGGFRTGTDVLKALALGARMVFVARPVLWGLATNGSSGAESVLDLLKSELTLAMSFCGCRDVKEISPSLLIHEGVYLASKL